MVCRTSKNVHQDVDGEQERKFFIRKIRDEVFVLLKLIDCQQQSSIPSSI